MQTVALSKNRFWSVLQLASLRRLAITMSTDFDRELEKFVRDYNFVIPDRGDLDDPTIEWRTGKPDYRRVNLLYFQGKSKNHKQASLEMTVENLVKAWEMELSHKPDVKNWLTVEPDTFTALVNGGPAVSGKELASMGSYNWLLRDVSKDLYDVQSHGFESSYRLFHGAFVDGFAWEVLEVFSGPPKVAFTWRHWGPFTGEFNGRKGKGENIELYGFTVATMSDNGKIVAVEAYTKMDPFLQALHGKLSPSEMEKGRVLLGSCCPIHKSKKVEPGEEK